MKTFAFAVILFFAAWVQIPAKGEPVALVTDVSGGVRVESGGAHSRAHVLVELSAGDHLVLSPHSSIRVVFYHDTHSETAYGPCRIKIAGARCVVETGGAHAVARFLPYQGIHALSPILSYRREFGGVAVRGAVTLPVVLSPVHTISSTRPAFEWRGSPGAQGYKVKLIGPLGNLLWESVTNTGSMRYPADKPPLERGEAYTFEVDTRDSSNTDWIFEGQGGFEVLSRTNENRLESLERQTGEEIEKNPNDPSPYAVRFAFYLENDLLEDASRACWKLRELDSDSPAVEGWCERLNRQLGNTGLRAPVKTKAPQ